MIIRKVRSSHVEEAAKIWTQQPGYKGFRDSTKYDVFIKGSPYPPKAIVAISREQAGFKMMRPSEFAGAKDGRWHTMLKDLEFRIVPKGVIPTEFDEIGASASIDTDIESVEIEHRNDPTMRATLIMARLGQGQFRKDLLEKWNNQCAVTGCGLLPVLRASHAKPWRSSNDSERLDPNNGLPLVATLDALFDAGLIGFSEQGRMLISENLGDISLLKGIPRKLRIQPTQQQTKYLRYHSNSVFQKNESAM